MLLTVTPAELEIRVSALIGIPYLARGDTPAGWDCRGCVRWCLGQFCGVETPDYRSLYTVDQASGPGGRRLRAALIADGLAAGWEPVEPRPGAVAWLGWLGTAGHVGFMLDGRRVLHADARCGTALLDLDDPAAGYRLVGAFRIRTKEES